MTPKSLFILAFAKKEFLRFAQNDNALFVG